MMSVPTVHDPRPGLAPGDEADVRPLVDRPRAGLSGFAIGALAVLAGVILFGVLEVRRRELSAPAAMTRTSDRTSGAAALPPLYIPPQPSLPVAAPSPLPAATVQPIPSPLVAVPIERRSAVPVPAQVYERAPVVPPVALVPPARVAGGAALVMDSGLSSSAPNAPVPDGNDGRSGSRDGRNGGFDTGRVRAAMLANRATTVPQGTLIPAVLETAFDSTHAGFARALVQRDIRGFDGTRILIPRGSRLIGEYGEDVAQGQRRAIILWTRLIRPDGVTIAIGSPAVDPLGRGGVKADVNTHFLERFSGAILQSTFDIGIGLAARSSRSPVVVALPGSISGLGRATPQPAEIKPTLKVPAARSVSIFVARDLDFTGMDTLP